MKQAVFLSHIDSLSLKKEVFYSGFYLILKNNCATVTNCGRDFLILIMTKQLKIFDYSDIINVVR